MSNGYYQKKTTNKSIKNRLIKGIKIFQKKRKTKSVNMLVKGIKILLKKKKTKSENIAVNAIKIYLKKNNKN